METPDEMLAMIESLGTFVSMVDGMKQNLVALGWDERAAEQMVLATIMHATAMTNNPKSED